MIGVLSQGRLGNQMFQFAFAYCAAKQLNTDFFFEGKHSLHYFDLDREFYQNNGKNKARFAFTNLLKRGNGNPFQRPLRRIPENIKQFLIRKNIVEWPNQLGNSNYLLHDLKDNTFYSGFFQSAEYFDLHREDIERLFTIKQRYRDVFLKTKAHLFDKKTIAIHIRRADYITFGDEQLGGYNMTLPTAYYHRCLSLMEEIDGYTVIFISDDIEFVKAEFGEKSNYVFECNDEITDFQLLLHADVVITANSTFSWWAAWLNQKKNKRIFAPNYFLGFKVNQYYPAGIYVKEWQWIDVNA
jgi:hypothetical protein